MLSSILSPPTSSHPPSSWRICDNLLPKERTLRYNQLKGAFLTNDIEEHQNWHEPSAPKPKNGWLAPISCLPVYGWEQSSRYSCSHSNHFGSTTPPFSRAYTVTYSPSNTSSSSPPRLARSSREVSCHCGPTGDSSNTDGYSSSG